MRYPGDMQYESEGLRRVAGTLLRHVRPRSRAEAYVILDGRLGVYGMDHAAIEVEIDRYFRVSVSHRAAA